jgi:anti-anti-sigma regulatory factor
MRVPLSQASPRGPRKARGLEGPLPERISLAIRLRSTRLETKEHPMMVRSGSSAECVLVFSGSVRIMEADEVARGLRDVLTLEERLVILDLQAIESLDVTFLQILLAFQRSVVRQGGHLMVQGLTPGHLVTQTASLLGVPLEKHFVTVGAAS